jgi:hypothetical protein
VKVSTGQQRFLCPIHPRATSPSVRARHDLSLSISQHPLLHPPSPQPSLLPLSHSHLILKTDAHFILFWPSCSPPPNLILSPNARSKMKQRMYELPSERSTICAMARSSTHLHTPQAMVVRILPHFLHLQSCSLCPASLASQPTPALSIASSSNSPTLTTPTLASEDLEEDAGLYSRVSTMPVVGTAIRVYEQSKASSRVVKVCYDFLHLALPRTTFTVTLILLSSMARR